MPIKTDILRQAAIDAASDPKHFNMRYYAYDPDYDPDEGAPATLDPETNQVILGCGTALCLAGFIVWRHDPEFFIKHTNKGSFESPILQRAYEIIEDEGEECDELFNGDNSVAYITSENVVERVEEYIQDNQLE